MTSLSTWLKPDETLRAALDAKDHRAVQAPQDYFTALPDSYAAQAEALQIIADHVCTHFPDTYFRMGQQIDIIPAFRRLRLDDPLTPPLLIAAGLVAEDVLLVEKDAGQWRVTARAAVGTTSDIDETLLDDLPPLQPCFRAARTLVKLPGSEAVLITVCPS